VTVETALAVLRGILKLIVPLERDEYKEFRSISTVR